MLEIGVTEIDQEITHVEVASMMDMVRFFRFTQELTQLALYRLVIIGPGEDAGTTISAYLTYQTDERKIRSAIEFAYLHSE